MAVWSMVDEAHEEHANLRMQQLRGKGWAGSAIQGPMQGAWRRCGTRRMVKVPMDLRKGCPADAAGPQHINPMPHSHPFHPTWCWRRLATLKQSHWVPSSWSWQAMISLKRRVLALLEGVLRGAWGEGMYELFELVCSYVKFFARMMPFQHWVQSRKLSCSLQAAHLVPHMPTARHDPEGVPESRVYNAQQGSLQQAGGQHLRQDQEVGADAVWIWRPGTCRQGRV